MKIKVDIYADDFRRTHGRSPRGYTAWAFYVMDSSCSPARHHTTLSAPHSMSYAAACSWVRDYVRTHLLVELRTGCLYLEVAP